jgi:hypothetical protein
VAGDEPGVFSAADIWDSGFFLALLTCRQDDIPDDSGILIEESLRPGHFDIFATFDQLHPYLAPDFKEEVVKEG